MSRRRTPEEQLDALYDELVEATLRADETALDAMIGEEGRDPVTVVASVRARLDTASKVIRSRRMQDAKLRYVQSVARLHEHQRSLPSTPDARRELLERTLQRSATAREALTLQHREFSQMTDEDVSSLLGQLAALGALPVDGGQGGGSGDPS